jgi:hypothetical protein
MTRGVVTKVVRSYGSEWGKVRAEGTDYESFFNRTSLAKAGDFALVEVGQTVEFVEEPDRANGTRAVQLTILSDAPEAAETEPVAAQS